MKRTILFLLAIFALVNVSEARQPGRGYRGFVDWSNSVRRDDFGAFDNRGNIYVVRQGSYYTGLSTSHGYQIDPMFFVGAGLGVERHVDYDYWIVPVFIQGRVDLQFGKFTPFGDVRLGVNTGEGVGVYFSPTIGYRFNWGRKTGINLGLGLTLAGYRSMDFEGTWTEDNTIELYYIGERHHVRPYFSFRLGIDF